MAEIIHVQHKPERVRAYLDDARTIVTELGLDGDLRGLGFVKAVELLAGVHISVEGERRAPMPHAIFPPGR